VEFYDATAYVDGGWNASLDPLENLILEPA
jgi:hypothetical protein